MRGIVLRGGSLPRPGFWGHFFFNFYFFRIFFFSIPSLGGEAVFGLGGAPLPDGRIRRARGLWGWGGGRGAPPHPAPGIFGGAAGSRPARCGRRERRAGVRAQNAGRGRTWRRRLCYPARRSSPEPRWQRGENVAQREMRRQRGKEASEAKRRPSGNAARTDGSARPGSSPGGRRGSSFVALYNGARPPARPSRTKPRPRPLVSPPLERQSARGQGRARCRRRRRRLWRLCPSRFPPPREKGGGRSPCCGPRRALTACPPALLPLGRPVPQNVPLVHFQVWCAPVWRKQGRAAVWKEIWKPWGEAGEKEVEPG